MRGLCKNTLVVVNFTGLPAAFAEISFGMIRPRDASAVYAHPRPQLVRLEERGRLHRVATGYYAVVPTAEDGAHWLPTLEATGYGIAASDYGPDHAVLMGLSAARLHAAVPRALAVAVVATDRKSTRLNSSHRH